MTKLVSVLTICKCLFLSFFTVSSAVADSNLTFTGGAKQSAYIPSIIVPILTEAFKRIDVQFNAEYNPAARSLKLSNSGDFDGELHRSKNFQEASGGGYANLKRIEFPFLTMSTAAYSKKDFKINSWDDLKGKSVAFKRGRKKVQKILSEKLDPSLITPVTTDLQAFKMVALGRVDVAISATIEGKKLIASNPELAEINQTGIIEQYDVYSYLNKKHEVLLPMLVESLKEMQRDGTLSEIVKKVEVLYHSEH